MNYTKVDEKLTPRQREIMNLVAHGYRNKEIAFQLGIKPSTVKSQTFEIKYRLDAGSLEHAVFILFGQDTRRPKTCPCLSCPERIGKCQR